MIRKGTLAALALLLLASCTPAPHKADWASVRELTPARFTSQPAFDPWLAAEADGRVALTYVTRDSNGADVWIALSTDSGAHFAEPVRLNARRGSVSSYPESRPVATFGGGQSLVVAWASAREGGHMADDIVARASADGGATFEPEARLNDEHTLEASPYHGFIALDATPNGRVIATWIDARGKAIAPGAEEPWAAQISATWSDDGGHTWQPNVLVADSVCPCCRPNMRAGASGLVAVAFRGVRDSLRDPHLAISRDGGATFGKDTLLSADRWKLPGCPVAGPALTLRNQGGLVAWYTGADSAAGVWVIPWRAGSGAAGPKRLLVEPELEGARPMLVPMGSVTLAGAIARPSPERHALALRTLAADGTPSPWLHLGVRARSAALAAADTRHAYAAWLEQAEAGPRLRLVRVTRR